MNSRLLKAFVVLLLATLLFLPSPACLADQAELEDNTGKFASDSYASRLWRNG